MDDFEVTLLIKTNTSRPSDILAAIEKAVLTTSVVTSIIEIKVIKALG